MFVLWRREKSCDCVGVLFAGIFFLHWKKMQFLLKGNQKYNKSRPHSIEVQIIICANYGRLEIVVISNKTNLAPYSRINRWFAWFMLAVYFRCQPMDINISFDACFICHLCSITSRSIIQQIRGLSIWIHTRGDELRLIWMVSMKMCNESLNKFWYTIYHT